MEYISRKESKNLINADENIKLYFAKLIFTSSSLADVGGMFNTNSIRHPKQILDRTNNQLSDQLENYIKTKQVIKNAPEHSLPSIMKK